MITGKPMLHSHRVGSDVCERCGRLANVLPLGVPSGQPHKVFHFFFVCDRCAHLLFADVRNMEPIDVTAWWAIRADPFKPQPDFGVLS